MDLRLTDQRVFSHPNAKVMCSEGASAKPRFHSVGSRLFSLGLLAFATGCAYQTVHLETVDANTGRPLAGVATEWREHRYQMFQKIMHFPATNLPPTGPDGVVKVRHLHRNWTSTFVFSCPGCPTLYGKYSGGALYSGGVLTLGTNVAFFPQEMLEGDFQFEGDAGIAIKTNGFFLVKMLK
jgi:hypothetical protein